MQCNIGQDKHFITKIMYSCINQVQWSLYFKTTCGTMKMWSHIASGLKIKVQ